MSALESNPWLTGIRATSSGQLRLFCFPYAGAGTRVFATWGDRLPAWVQVCPVQYPGRNHRVHEPPFRNLVQLVHAMVEGMADCFDRPFACFGHSMGALVSFELTRLLRERFGVHPHVLLMSGSRAPQIPPREPPIYDLPDGLLIEELRELNGTPSELFDNRECLDLLLPIVRADFEAVQTYTYRPSRKLAVPIVAFGGTDDTDVLPDDLEAWRDMTTGTFVRETLPGGHFFPITAQYLLLDRVCAVLDGVTSGLAGQRPAVHNVR